MFGSVTTRDIAKILEENGISTISKSQISLLEPIKNLGIFEVKVNLHAEVSCVIKINVARTEEEAELQEKGITSSSPEDGAEEIIKDGMIDVFDEGVDAKIEEEDIEDTIKKSPEEDDSNTSDDPEELDQSKSK